MADLSDKAQAIIEQERNYAVATYRKPATEAKVMGHCLNCGAAIKSARWCDAECRNEWEKYNR